MLVGSRWIACGTVTIAMFLVAASAQRAVAVITIGFENSEGYTNGALSPDINTAQQGWSGGAQGGFTNNDHASVTDESDITADEAVTQAAAHSGTNSWRLSRGYNSPGQGTPFSPYLPSFAAPTNNGDKFTASLWFKAVSLTADNSVVKLNTGTPDGTDRANIVAYLQNDSAGGVTISSYTFDGTNFNQFNLFTNVSTADWHQLSFTLTKSGFDDPLAVSLDGGTPVDFNGSLNQWRQSLGFTYAASGDLKFTPGQDGDPASKGFYIDDISYNVSAVPEAGAFWFGAMAASGVGLVVGTRAVWRKSRENLGSEPSRM